MSFWGILLSLGAAIAFSGFDVARKRVSPHFHPLALTVWLQIGSIPFLVGWCTIAGFRWSEAWLLPGLGSVGLQAAASAAFLTALSISPLSRTIPFLSLTPVLSAASAWILIGEEPGSSALAGMALVSAGAFGLALRSSGTGFQIERGSLLTILVAGLWSASSAVDKRALAFANAPSHALLVTTGVALILAVERWLRRGISGLYLPPRARGGLLIASVAGSVALGLQLSAFSYALVSSVESLKRALGGISALVFGRIAFGESVGFRTVVSVLVMIAGAVLVLRR